MKVIFYDRTNKREVSNIELFRTNLVIEFLTQNSQESDIPPTHHAVQIAELSYRSEECPSYVNGDLYTSLNDLVFLRLE